MEKIKCKGCGFVEFGTIEGDTVGGRLLESVWFEIRVDESGEPEAKVVEKSRTYFENLNQEMWLKRIGEHAKEDWEESLHCGKCFYLVTETPWPKRVRGEVRQIGLLSMDDILGKKFKEGK